MITSKFKSLSYRWPVMSAGSGRFIVSEEPKVAIWDLEQKKQEGGMVGGRGELGDRRTSRGERFLSGRQKGRLPMTQCPPTKDPVFPGFLSLNAVKLFILVLYSRADHNIWSPLPLLCNSKLYTLQFSDWC